MKTTVDTDNLLRKYDVAVPRYTSYPSVPCWDNESFSASKWLTEVRRQFVLSNPTRGISLYIHLPFCESLCTYCACNTRITRNHAVEELYIETILREWMMYQALFPEKPVIRELHIGGGTPTFFSPSNLERLIKGVLATSSTHPNHSFSLEGHPNNTTEEHLKALHRQGFRRISYGVQDLDERVQKAIHRVQPYENVERVVRQSRDIGFSSVSLDLIYGLPYQTLSSISHTFKKVVQLRPDRLSFYSYAHVPWIKPGQRGYEDADLPGDKAKRALYECGKAILLAAGYAEIGMDHFALPDDELFEAKQNGTLHRNFMGYTDSQTDLLLGLGVSAIGDAQSAYGQNIKTVEEYEEQVWLGKLPIQKGHLLTEKDRRIRKIIKDLSCKGWTDVCDEVKGAAARLDAFVADGLVEMSDTRLSLTSEGWAFVRNVCAVFDTRLPTVDGKNIFSKAV